MVMHPGMRITAADLKGVSCPSVCEEQVTRRITIIFDTACLCLCVCVSEDKDRLALGKDSVTKCYFFKGQS